VGRRGDAVATFRRPAVDRALGAACQLGKPADGYASGFEPGLEGGGGGLASLKIIFSNPDDFIDETLLRYLGLRVFQSVYPVFFETYYKSAKFSRVFYFWFAFGFLSRRVFGFWIFLEMGNFGNGDA
jgi:hypothetical protein